MNTLFNPDKVTAIETITAILPTMKKIDHLTESLVALDEEIRCTASVFDSYEAWEVENQTQRQRIEMKRNIQQSLTEAQSELYKLHQVLRYHFPLGVWILVDRIYYRFTEYGGHFILEWQLLDPDKVK